MDEADFFEKLTGQKTRSCIKPDLELELEKEGWTFLTNEDATDYAGIKTRFGIPTNPLSDEQIRELYLQQGFKDVLVVQGYDREWNLRAHLRGVYIKGA